MALARCPYCDRLCGIKPTGKRIGADGTAQYWRLDDHETPVPDHGTTMIMYVRCEGSSKLV